MKTFVSYPLLLFAGLMLLSLVSGHPDVAAQINRLSPAEARQLLERKVHPLPDPAGDEEVFKHDLIAGTQRAASSRTVASAGPFWQQTSGPTAYNPVRTFGLTPGGDMYASVLYDGVFRSTDNGASWTHTALYNSYVRAIISNSSGDIFAGSYTGTATGLYRSTDAGATWQLKTSGMTIKAVASLALTSGGKILAGMYPGGVYCSTDNGESWQQSSLTSPSIYSFAIHANGTAFAGSSSGRIYSSTDAGNTWSLRRTNAPDMNVLSLTTGGANDVYAATSNGGVYYSSDNGASWTPRSSGLTNPTVYTIVLDAGSRLFAGTWGGGVFSSTDAGASWSPVGSGLVELSIYSLAFNAPGDLLEGGNSAGVFRSTDHGATWFASCSGLPPLLNTSIWGMAKDAAGDLFAASGAGMYRTSDGGASWTQLSAGLTDPGTISVTVNALGEIYTGTWYGRIFKSTNNGNDWSLSTETGPGSIWSMASHGSAVFAGANGTLGGVFRTTNSGTTWEKVLSSGGDNYWTVAVSPGGEIVAGEGQSTTALYVSTDDGTTWTTVTPSGATGLFWFVAFSSGGNIFAGLYSSGSDLVYRSTDHGASWSSAQNGLTNNLGNFMLSDARDHLFLMTDNGVFRSIDQGNHWLELSSGLTIAGVQSGIVDNGGYLYAGSLGAGVFRSVTPLTQSFISGMKFNDVNYDGVRDPGESGLEGWFIGLTSTEFQWTLTQADGYYQFSDLSPGLYTVSEGSQANWTQTMPGLPGVYMFTITGPTVHAGIDFGNSFLAQNNFLAGIDPSALDGVDPMDVVVAPPPPADYLTCYFLLDPGNYLPNYSVDIKKDEPSLAARAKIWNFRAATDRARTMVSIFFPIGGLPTGFTPVLYDLTTGGYQNLRLNPQYIYQAPGIAGAVSSFMLYIGDSTKPAVAVTEPNGGEYLIVGQTATISWTSSDASGLLAHDVLYSLNGTAPYTLIGSVGGSEHSLDWIPPASSGTASIKVVARDSVLNESADVSDGSFTILASNSIAFGAIGGWNLVSVPMLQAVMSPAAVFGDDYVVPYFTFQYSREGGYSVPSTLIMGQGYWLGANSPQWVDAVGTPLSSASLALLEGFNIIGNPFATGEPKENLLFTDGVDLKSMTDAAAAGWLSNVLYAYNGSGYEFENSMLDVWTGYWLPMLRAGITVQYTPATSVPSMKTQPEEVSATHWSVELSAHLAIDGEQATDKIAAFGLRADARSGSDPRYDAPRPPRSPADEYVEVSFLDGGERFARLFRSQGDEGWVMEVLTSGEGTVTLSWDNALIRRLPETIKVEMRDLENHQLLDMKREGSYTYSQVGDRHRFLINGKGIGVDLEVPDQYALGQNYPNPFNPRTTISYELPMQSQVTLKILDLLGREVTTLVNGVEQPGYKSVNFDASGLPSGVYYYRLQAGTYVETKKLLLLR